MDRTWGGRRHAADRCAAAALPAIALRRLWQVAPGCIVDEAAMERLGLLDADMVRLEVPG